MSTIGGPRLSTIPPTFFNDYSFEFDGTDDRVEFDSSNWGTDSFTISMWINPSIISSTYKMLLGGSGYSIGTGIGHYIFNNTVKTWVSVGGVPTNLFTTSAVLSVGTWCHIVLAREKNVGWSLYINGTLRRQSTLRLTEDFSSPNSLIGKHYNNNYYFGGKIDEVGIFNSVIPIGDLWDGSGHPTDLTSINPTTWYRMGEKATYDGTDWTLVDQGSGGNNALSYNMVLSGRTSDVPT